MIGKKNIVFGFFYLVLTALLGPVMILSYYDDVDAAAAAKQTQFTVLQQAANSGFEIDLEPMTADQIAKTNTKALLALSAQLNARAPIDAIKGGPHTHGNLEALLNIAVGFLLMVVAVHRTLKQIISWIFIAGALLHSGLLYFAVTLHQAWAISLMATPVAVIGPILILVGLFLAGLAAALGFRGTVEPDV